MADSYLERHYLEYEKRKEEWLRRKKHQPKLRSSTPHKRADEGK